MKLTISDLGERLQMYRKTLDLSQKDLAAALESGQQNQISRLENGLGGSLELLLQLVNFYDAHFFTGFLFSEQFEVVRKIEGVPAANSYNSIVVERLKLLQTDITGQISEIIGIMETATS